MNPEKAWEQGDAHDENPLKFLIRTRSFGMKMRALFFLSLSSSVPVHSMQPLNNGVRANLCLHT